MAELTDLQKLLEIERIKQLKARYFRLLDTKQWADLRLQFTDDCVYAGTSKPFPDPDAWIAGVSRNHAETTTTHHGHMSEIGLEGADQARGIWAMTDYVTWSADARLWREGFTEEMYGFLGFGYYQERYRKEGGRWKIAELRLTRLRVDRLEGDPPQTLSGLLAPALDWLPAVPEPTS